MEDTLRVYVGLGFILSYAVLILILMEDTLRVGYKKSGALSDAMS